MSPDALSLPGKIALAALVYWMLPRLIPLPLVAMGLFHDWLGRLLPGHRNKARLAPLRHEFGSPPLGADHVSDETLISGGFNLVEARRTEAARRIVRKLRSRGCRDARLGQLELHIVRREAQIRRQASRDARRRLATS